MNFSDELLKYIKSVQESYYFKNNDKHYIIFPNDKKLYKVEYHDNTKSFKVKKYIFNIEYKDKHNNLKRLNDNEFKIENQLNLNNLKSLYDNECKIEKQLKFPIYNISEPKDFYFVYYK